MDLPSCMLPIGCPDLLSINLPCGGFWDLTAKFDELWRFHSSQSLLAVRDKRRVTQRGAWPKDNKCLHRLTPVVIRNSDDGAFVNVRQRHDRGLDFRTIDIEAAGDDHVFLSVHDVNVAVFIQIADIARMVPAMRADFRRGLGQLVVTVTNKGSAHDDLAALARRQNFARVIHDGKTDSRRRLATTRQAFRMHSGGSS